MMMMIINIINHHYCYSFKTSFLIFGFAFFSNSWACMLRLKVSGFRCMPHLYCAAAFVGSVVMLMVNSGMSSEMHRLTKYLPRCRNSLGHGRKPVEGWSFAPPCPHLKK